MILMTIQALGRFASECYVRRHWIQTKTLWNWSILKLVIRFPNLFKPDQVNNVEKVNDVELWTLGQCPMFIVGLPEDFTFCFPLFLSCNHRYNCCNFVMNQYVSHIIRQTRLRALHLTHGAEKPKSLLSFAVFCQIFSSKWVSKTNSKPSKLPRFFL